MVFRGVGDEPPVVIKIVIKTLAIGRKQERQKQQQKQ